jgi:hypothetical protein
LQDDDKEVGRMRRKRALASLLAVGSLALAVAVPANASLPQGNGLPGKGEFECDGLGTVVVVGPAAAPIGFTTGGLRLIARSAEGEFTDPEGSVITLTKTYGQMAGLGPFYTCDSVFEGGFLTVSLAIVPRES